MTTFIILLFFHASYTMNDSTKDIRVDVLMQSLGRTINEQKAFLKTDIVSPTQEVIKSYFPLKISHTVKSNNRYTFLGIPVEEIHLFVNDTGTIEAVFINLYNEEVINKLDNLIGPATVAAGSSVTEDVPFSFYSWDYKEGCIGVELNAYKLQFIPTIVRDTALIIINRCNPLAYVTVPEQ